MKKLILLSVLSALLNASAEDSYIYWMVPEIATGTVRFDQPIGGSYTAKVLAFEEGKWSESGGKLLSIYTASADGGLGTTPVEGVPVTIGSDGNNVAYFANIAGTGEGWTYFVELYNGGLLLARSADGASLPYSQESIAALSNGTIATPAKLWAPMTFVPAPEPNSALLLLIGCAALALRRRKQIAAESSEVGYA